MGENSRLSEEGCLVASTERPLQTGGADSRDCSEPQAESHGHRPSDPKLWPGPPEAEDQPAEGERDDQHRQNDAFDVLDGVIRSHLQTYGRTAGWSLGARRQSSAGEPCQDLVDQRLRLAAFSFE